MKYEEVPSDLLVTSRFSTDELFTVHGSVDEIRKQPPVVKFAGNSVIRLKFKLPAKRKQPAA